MIRIVFMRFGLRSLMMVLALGPLVLAGVWLVGAPIFRPISLAMALEVATGISLYTVTGFVLFVAAVRLVEWIAQCLLGPQRR